MLPSFSETNSETNFFTHFVHLYKVQLRTFSLCKKHFQYRVTYWALISLSVFRRHSSQNVHSIFYSQAKPQLMTEFPLLPVRHGSAWLYLMRIDIQFAVTSKLQALCFWGTIWNTSLLPYFAIFCHILWLITMPIMPEKNDKEGIQCFHNNLHMVVRVLVS